MSVAPRLMELQALDLEIEAKENRLAEIEAALGESAALLEARSRLHTARAQLHDQEAQQLDLEMQVGSLSEKIKDNEKKLYGGSVKSTRELSALEIDTKSLRNRRSDLEDRELELMEALDTSRAMAKELEAAYNQTEQAWQQEQARLREEQALLQEQVAGLRSAREKMAATITPSVLSTYDRLRRTRRGRAVALVERSTCQGCRIALPTQEVQKARLSPSLVFCSSCGRILCVTR